MQKHVQFLFLLSKLGVTQTFPKSGDGEGIVIYKDPRTIVDSFYLFPPYKKMKNIIPAEDENMIIVEILMRSIRHTGSIFIGLRSE